MARYLWKVTYSTEGARGLLAEGGSSRRATVIKLLESAGGTLEICSITRSARTTPTS